MLNSPFDRFRLVGYLEGISFLVLLGIGMPLKYKAGIPEAVLITGWIHGALFIAYVVLAVLLSSEERWPQSRLIWALFAAVAPFGPFVFDWWLRKRRRAPVSQNEPEEPLD